MNATIQEIEGIDDYWGPAFRSVYEGEGHEAFVQQLDERIIQHDKEIEKLCNFHYQKKRKRGRRPKKLRGREEQEEALQCSMSQYEDNNNHIPKRRCIDPKRLGGYINTSPEPGTQCERSDHNSTKVSDRNLSDKNLDETLDMGISSDEYEEITEYHTLQQLKQENHQLMSKELDSSTDDLRLYLRNRNRLMASVHCQNLLISVEKAGNRAEQQIDYSCKSMCDQLTVDKEVDVNSSKDLRSYLRSKLSDEQLGQDKPSYSEYDRRQSQPEVIQYDETYNHQVEYDKEQRRSLSSIYNIEPRQYGIRYEKRQIRRPSVEHNQDQIRSLSTECFKTQNQHEPIEYDRNQSLTLSSERTWRQSILVPKQYEKCQSRGASAEHDKVQGSLSSERNRRPSRQENFEYDKGQHRHVASELDRNKKRRKADSQRVKNRPMSAEDDRGKSLPEFVKQHETIRPSRLSSSKCYTRQNLHEIIGRSQSPHSLKGQIRHITLSTSERDGMQGLCVFVDQHRGLVNHSTEYDNSVCESAEGPKVRSRQSLTEHNIKQSRPCSDNYKQSLHPIIEYHKGQNQEQTRGSQRFSTDYDGKSVSSHESTDFDRGQGRQAKRRRLGKSRPLSSEPYQREIQGATMEYKRRERNHALSDEKSQSRSSSAEHYVQSGQSTEYTTGRNRSSERHRSRRGPASADNKIRHNRLSYFESQICHKVSEDQISRKGKKINEFFNSERGSLLTDSFGDVQTDLPSADITASHNQTYLSADLQQEKNPGFPKRYLVDDRPLTIDIGRQFSSETVIKHNPLLPETQLEINRKSPESEDLSRPLSTQKQPTSVELCRNSVIGQHTTAPGKLSEPYHEESTYKSSAVQISNRVTSSQFFQNEILEFELSHAERSDIQNLKSFDRQLKEEQTTEVKSCFDGVIKNSETVLILDSDTDVTMEISTPRSNARLSTKNPEEQNATHDFSDIDPRSKLTNRLEASALVSSRGSSVPCGYSRETFSEISSIQDISGNNRDSVDTVLVDLKTDDGRRRIVPAPDVKCEPNYTSYDEVTFNASNESSKERHLDQDNIGLELKRLTESNVKSEPIDHDIIREISSAVDKYNAQNRLPQEIPDNCPKFPNQSCDTATPSGFLKSEIKQESDNEVLNIVDSTFETDFSIPCGPNDADKQGQSSLASLNDASFRVSVRDVNCIYLLPSGAKIDTLNAVLNKTDECGDDHRKMDVSVVTTDSWYTPRKITLENYPDKLNITALVNSSDPRLRPRIKNSTYEILNEHKTEVLGEKDDAKSAINVGTDNTVATKSNFLTYIDGQTSILNAEEEKEPIAPNLPSKCGKLVLDIPNSSKVSSCSSYKAKNSPESPQIQCKQLFTSLKRIDIETQVASAIPIYTSSNKNHNINDWIDSVNKVAANHNWSDQQMVRYAIPKIMGNDFDSNISWIEWQEKLRTAFPPKVNYGKMLLTMLNTKAKVGDSSDSLVKYYYEKKTLLDKCNITGEKAIECIIFGIEDESVRTILDSLDFDNEEQLLIFLSNFKNKP